MKAKVKKVRKFVEPSLNELELRYRRLFETAQDGILILDARTGAITDVNPFLIDVLGYSRDEFIGKKLWEVGAFKNIQTSSEAFEALQKDKSIRHDDLPLKAKDGHLVSVDFVSNVYSENSYKVIQCTIRDITERQRAERERLGLAHDLQERVKELGCFYEVAKIIEIPDISLDEMLQRTVNIMPAAFQYPEIACARMVLHDKIFWTSNYSATKWRLSAELKLGGVELGRWKFTIWKRDLL